ncbi:MAG: ribose-5-phosphate isomerase RpiA [Candidatus Helarchaeota archaeon]
MTNQEQGKKLAARRSIDLLHDSDRIIGVGSGSTVRYAIGFLKERMKRDGLDIRAIPTSYETRFLLIENGIPITTLAEHPIVDVAIDGADEVDPNLNLIKGGGAALTLEKIVDFAARRLIIIVDPSKLVKTLGERFALPIAIIPEAHETVLRAIKEKYTQDVKIRLASRKLGPVVTDNGNFIIDAKFNAISNPETLERDLNLIPGVVENGLFLDMTDVVLIGKENSVEQRVKDKKSGQVTITDS